MENLAEKKKDFVQVVAKSPPNQLMLRIPVLHTSMNDIVTCHAKWLFYEIMCCIMKIGCCVLSFLGIDMRAKGHHNFLLIHQDCKFVATSK